MRQQNNLVILGGYLAIDAKLKYQVTGLANRRKYVQRRNADFNVETLVKYINVRVGPETFAVF